MPMSVRCEVELDIFSGMPNPTWALPDADAQHLLEQLAALPPSPAREASGNLGYRGLIIAVTQPAGRQVIRVQNGIVCVADGATARFASDAHRRLERWLLNTGRSHVDPELLKFAERDFQ